MEENVYTQTDGPGGIVQGMWTKEWPKDAGFYWFYGKIDLHDKNQLTVVEASHPFKGGPLVLNKGSIILRKSEGARGWWMEISKPPLPMEAK